MEKTLIKYKYWADDNPFYSYQTDGDPGVLLNFFKTCMKNEIKCGFNRYSNQVNETYNETEYQFLINDIQVTLPTKNDLLCITIITDDNIIEED